MLAPALLLISATAPAANLPDWMAGCWVEEPGEHWTEECWTSARAGSMLGSGRSGRGDQLTHWEVMQIIAEDPAASPARLIFWGAPRAQGRTAFAWNGKVEADAITFENAGHDYPQRIRYARDGSTLIAETSLIDGSKMQRWRYTRR